MGSVYLHILPENGSLCISDEQQKQIVHFVDLFFKENYQEPLTTENIYFENNDQIVVTCSVENCQFGMFCNNCRHAIESPWMFDQINEWWYNATPVRDSMPYFQCPHCKETLPGHQLAVDDFAESEDDEAEAICYHFGFARQFLSLWNPPNPFLFFNNKTMKALSELWGCPVFQIYSRL